VESTIASFSHGLELGVSTLELDVQITQDGYAVVTHDRKVTGTLLGGAGGALIGGAIGDTKGAVIGGLGGAVVGNQVARTKCDRHVAYRTRYVHRASPQGYDAARDAAPRGCTYENRRYYDERGQVTYAPVRICR